MPNRNTPSPYRNDVCGACVEVTMHKAGVCMQCIECGLEWADNAQNIAENAGWTFAIPTIDPKHDEFFATSNTEAGD
jgi:hypothetical protein